MRSVTRTCAAALCAALAILALSTAAHAADFRCGGKIAVPAGDTLRDDLYVCGGKVDIDGVVLGDVVAFGGNLNLNGAVSGSVFSGGGSTVIAGPVGGTIRSAGGEIRILNQVGGDVVAGCGRLQLAPGSHVGRDVLAGGGDLDLDGEVDRNVFAGGGAFTLSGRVGGNVRLRAERSRLADGARVAGDFVYYSDRSVVRSPGAMVGGRIEQRVPRGHPQLGVVGRMMAFFYRWERLLVGLLAIGLLLVLPFPAFTRRVLDALGGSPGASVGTGLVLALAVPFVAITIGLMGILIGGWWIGMGALVLFSMSLSLGVAVTGAYIGRRLLQRPGQEVRLWTALLAGLALLTLVVRVPILGGCVAIIAALFGLGALAIAARRGGSGAVAVR
jgi:hypothetical protein